MDEFERIKGERDSATKKVIDSTSRKKLVVAGPGTGKTYLFKRVLTGCGGKGLALTFIRNLVADLKEALSDVADVFTFHGFCKHQLYRHAVEGLQEGWDYFPPLLILLTHDLQILGREGIDRSEVERCLHDLDSKDNIITETLALGDYYNAVSHTDLVYRVLKYFEHHAEKIPTYPLVVVDEYQDFSRLETNFINLLATKSPILIAGDDDQALYAFKNASARYIRELASDTGYEKFDLPYCSRCTQVIVDAVKETIDCAIKQNLLKGRVKKDFECYLPDKQSDSKTHPKIIHAHCSVERKGSPFVGRYIAQQITCIPTDDVQESHENNYPTALVIGPNPFLKRAYEEIVTKYPQATLKKAPELTINPLDAYQRLSRNTNSRLGWRILVNCSPPDNVNVDEMISQALKDRNDLKSVLPGQYVEHHLKNASIIRQLMDSQTLTKDEEELLCRTIGATIDDIKNTLQLETGDEDNKQEENGTDVDSNAPSIVCTSLVGAKGLSAGHVFIIGCNDGHFPRYPHNITDEEICCLIVGLSRTRKKCHLVSCKFLGRERLNISTFVTWIGQHLQTEEVDASYFKKNSVIPQH